jgi:hypothetical protein
LDVRQRLIEGAVGACADAGGGCMNRLLKGLTLALITGVIELSITDVNDEPDQ